MIKTIEGNLFDTSADIICHQVNCAGRMGSGVALQVKERYPEVYEDYRKAFEEGRLKLGEVIFSQANDGKIIANLCAQDGYGYDGKLYTDYDALKKCLMKVGDYARRRNPSIIIMDMPQKITRVAFPYKMSCDRGGGDWDTVFKMIRNESYGLNIEIWKLKKNNMLKFDAEKVKDDIVLWIRDWFEENGKGCTAVVGISGGKDSSVVAALCVEALGKDRVYGVLMPDGEQSDILDSFKVVEHLGIKASTINIRKAVDAIYDGVDEVIGSTDQMVINLPPRIRMATLYAVAQALPNGGRVSNNCNLSEDWVGYSTRYGDSAGDFSPISNLTVTEVKELGKALGLPIELVDKTPSDGLCGKSDEDNLGFTYDTLDKYIRTGEIEDEKVKERIDYLHKKNLFKLQVIPAFVPQLS